MIEKSNFRKNYKIWKNSSVLKQMKVNFISTYINEKNSSLIGTSFHRLRFKKVQENKSNKKNTKYNMNMNFYIILLNLEVIRVFNELNHFYYHLFF